MIDAIDTVDCCLSPRTKRYAILKQGRLQSLFVERLLAAA